VRRGPKAAASTDPLPLEGLPPAGGARVAEFARRFLVVPRGHGAGGPLLLRRWQLEIVDALFGEPRPWTGLLSLPRGQGKTTLSAALGLYALHADGVAGPQVLAVASDERQAGIVLGLARRMTELSAELAERTVVYRDRLVVPRCDGAMFALPSEAAAVEGYDPTLCLVDELAHVPEPVWESLTGYAGKRSSSLTLAISTPAASEDSLMYRLVAERRANPSPLHYLREYAAPAGCALDDESAWEQANPALDDFASRDALRSKLTSLREPAFRRYCLGQWVTGSESWLPFGAWAAVADPARVVPDGTEVVVGFDGSASGDSTALVAATVEPTPHVFLLEAWENPGDARWRVPRQTVIDAVDAVFDRFTVREMVADPWGWRTELQGWQERHGDAVIEQPTNVVSRMAPACDKFYAAVIDRRLTHDGDSRLARHVNNAAAKSTSLGDVVVKDRRNSPNKIDACVAAVIAHDRAVWLATRTQPKRRVLSW